MPSNNSKKIFEGLISRTKVYLILIAILLGIICIFNVMWSFDPYRMWETR